MAEFVVGQWVEVIDGMAGYLRVGHVQQIEKITDIGTIKLFGNGNCWDASRFKPFVWQVGKTYRTTLEGVTATIKSLSSSSVSADASDKPGTVCFHLCTGKLLGMESREDQPHLLPFLADEPSEPEAVKPQASSPYDRVIGSVEVDLWTLADIYGITSHRLFSAWKKITMAGRRGPKDKLRDLKEARVALDKEIAKLEAEGGAE
jgi:hypothetical protein